MSSTLLLFLQMPVVLAPLNSLMGSSVLTQTMFMVPRISAQCPANMLGLSAVDSPCPSSFNSTVVSLSRLSLNAKRSNVSSVVAISGRRSFVVRAADSEEVNPDIDTGADTDADAEAPVAENDVESEAEVEASAEAEEKPPRKPRIKLGEIMGILHKRAIEASENERPVADIRTGDIVEIKLEVPENRRRLSVYKGIVMSRQNAGIHTTIRIRRIIAGIGVEIVFPVYSPNIKEIKVVSHRKVRRARLYYLREKLPRLSTFK